MVQDVFLKVWINRLQLPSITKFTDYLFILARNHIFSELRKKIYEEPFSDHLVNYFRDAGNLPDQQLLYRETQGLVAEAIGKMPPQQRLIYSMSREEGLSQEEIATRCAISKNTVKSHMNKALQFIRNYLLTHAGVETFTLLFYLMYGMI